MVDIETVSRSAASLGRKWNLSSWPLRRKVASIVAPPLVLAMGFGALQVQGELAAAAELSTASENVRMVDPILRLDTLVGSESLAGSINDDNQFEETVGAVRAAVVSTIGADSPQYTGVEAAINIAASLRDRMSAGFVPPIERAESAAAVTDILGPVLQSAMAFEDIDIRAATYVVLKSLSGRRAAQNQQLLVSEINPEVLEQANRLVGRETADIAILADVLTPADDRIVRLTGLLDSRLRMYSAAATGAPVNPSLAAEQAAQVYATLASDYSQSLSGLLAAESVDTRSAALRAASLVLAAVLLALVLALLVARSLVEPIRKLRLGALGVARRDLPAEIEQIRAGGHTPQITPVPVHTEEEIGQLARAVDAIHEEALQLAGEQARLRVQVGNMFETLSRRSRSLVDQQLALIEELERDEDEPRRLDSLFRLDHLATRMRRNGANLMVLADTPSRRGHGDQPVALDSVMSAAVSEVEDYRRVLMLDVPDTALTPAAAPDVVHLVAELIDNALRYSPPDSAVAVTASRAIEGGIILEVADRGLGMPPADIEETNERLSAGGEVTPETARRMGLFVVGRLAQRHGVTVWLRATQVQGATSGVTASVHIPAALVVTFFPTTETRSRVPRRDVPQPAFDVPAAETGLFAADERHNNGETASERTGPVSLVSVKNHLPPSTYASTTDQEATKEKGHVTGLPRRRPGASGVDERLSFASGPRDTGAVRRSHDPAADTPQQSPLSATSPPATSPPATPPLATSLSDAAAANNAAFEASSSDGATANTTPSNTSAFFGARPMAQSARPIVQDREAAEPAAPADPATEQASNDPLLPPHSPIYQDLVSEWLVDPATGQGRSHVWSSPADAGWAAARQADDSTIGMRTESGLPVRRPGSRLVPGRVDSPSRTANQAPSAERPAGPRSPDAVREKLTNHFTGVRIGRAEDVTGRHRTEEGE